MLALSGIENVGVTPPKCLVDGAICRDDGLHDLGNMIYAELPVLYTSTSTLVVVVSPKRSWTFTGVIRSVCTGEDK